MSASSVHESSPTSFGVSLAVEGGCCALHRQEISVGSITTPLFSPEPENVNENDEGSLRALPVDNVHDQVASHVAVRAIRKLKTADNIHLGVSLTLSKSDDAAFLRLVAAHLASHPSGIPTDKTYLLAVPTTGAGDTSLLICGNDATKVQRAALLAMSKFIGHIKPLPDQDAGSIWIGRVRGLAWNEYDETALWDVLQKSAQELIDTSLTRLRDLVASTRSLLRRARASTVSPHARRSRSSGTRMSKCRCC